MDDHLKWIKGERRRLNRPILQPQKPDRLTAKADSVGQWKMEQVEEFLKAMSSEIAAADIHALAATFVDPTKPVVKAEPADKSSTAPKSAASTNPIISALPQEEEGEIHDLPPNAAASGTFLAAEGVTDPTKLPPTSDLNAQSSAQGAVATVPPATGEDQSLLSAHRPANGNFQSAFKTAEHPELKNFVLPAADADSARPDVALRVKTRAKKDPTGHRYFTLSSDLSARHKLTTISLDNHVELCTRIEWLIVQTRGHLNLKRDQSRAWESQLPETFDWELIRRLRLSLTDHAPQALKPWSKLLVAASECACEWTRMLVFLEAAALLRRWRRRFLKEKHD
jgi:hypothetical protein